MIALLSDPGGGTGAVGGSPISRVRNHLHMSLGTQGSPQREGELRRDLQALLARLRRLQARGGDLARVRLSPQVQQMVKSLKVVGNEMLVLMPERKGA